MTTHHIYVISDLHLGGCAPEKDHPGFQMCSAPARRRLGRFIHYIAGAHANAVTELVINGDFVDFLAEKPFQAFTEAPGKAVKKLRSIIDSTDAGAVPNEQVFPALRDFVQQGHRLTIMLGNHDIELSLPAVRAYLSQYLTAGRAAHIQFVYDGEALRRGPVLIEHGNRYDAWNVINQSRLRAFRSAQSRQEKLTFTPPLGSRLVTEVMNDLKEKYCFVDLLKPENEAVLPILAAIEPGCVTSMLKIAPLQMQKMMAETASGQPPKNVSQIADQGNTPYAKSARWQPTENMTQDAEFVTAAQTTATSQLAQAQALLRELQSTQDRPDEHISDGAKASIASTYSFVAMLVNHLTKKDAKRWQHLRNALVAHRQSIGATFALDSEDPVYHKAAQRLTKTLPGVVIFGHTHLPKSIALHSDGLYLNTGTWCRTIQLPASLYQPGTDNDKLTAFVEDMRHNKLGRWAKLHTCCAYVALDDAKLLDAGLFLVGGDKQLKIRRIGNRAYNSTGFTQ